MRKAWSFIRRSKRRTAIATVVALLVPAGTAFAFYMLMFTGTGSTQAVLNGPSTQTGTVTVSIPNLAMMSPGGALQYTVKAVNPVEESSSTVSQPPTMTITSSDPANCPASWFTTIDASAMTSQNLTAQGITPLTYPVTVPVNTGSNQSATIGIGDLQMTDSGTDQSACKGVQITVTATTP